MKRVLKWAGIVVGVIVLGVGGFALYVNFSGMKSYEVAVPKLKFEYTAERVERGRVLVSTFCAECHKDAVTKQLTGHQMWDLPEELGVAYSRNITQHPTKGIGKWSDGDLAWLLRTGIHPKTGLYVPPWMVKLPLTADEDIFSIIAFLRSDDPMVAANETENQESKPSFLAKMLVKVGVFKPFDYPSSAIALPDTSDQVAYGKYLADDLLGCFACHSADFKTMDENDPPKSEGYYGGGNPTLDAGRHPVPTPNITPGSESFSKWTQEEFVTAMKTGFRPNGKLMGYPMGRLNHLKDIEITAIYQFLKTLPPISKPNIAAMEVPLSSHPTQGEKLFNKYGCVRCHGEKGSGYGDLTLADSKYPTDEHIAEVINHPERVFPGTSMPAWEGRIAENDMIEIAKHVRILSKNATK